MRTANRPLSAARPSHSHHQPTDTVDTLVSSQRQRDQALRISSALSVASASTPARWRGRGWRWWRRERSYHTGVDCTERRAAVRSWHADDSAQGVRLCARLRCAPRRRRHVLPPAICSRSQRIASASHSAVCGQDVGRRVVVGQRNEQSERQRLWSRPVADDQSCGQRTLICFPSLCPFATLSTVADQCTGDYDGINFSATIPSGSHYAL